MDYTGLHLVHNRYQDLYAEYTPKAPCAMLRPWLMWLGCDLRRCRVLSSLTCLTLSTCTRESSFDSL